LRDSPLSNLREPTNLAVSRDQFLVSGRHAQVAWVWGRLNPCLEAGGVEVLIDRERLRASKAVYRSLRRRMLVTEQTNLCELRVPLMRRWLRQRG